MRILIGALVLASAPLLAADLSQQLTTCRQLSDNQQRLQCYDQMTLSSTTSAAGSAATSAAVSVAERSQPTSPAMPVQTRAETEFEFGKKLARPVDTIEKIDSQIKSVKYNLQKKALIRLENGQLWQQIENVQMNLSSGKACSVQRAALGSFLLKCTGSSKTMRVTRLE